MTDTTWFALAALVVIAVSLIIACYRAGYDAGKTLGWREGWDASREAESRYWQTRAGSPNSWHAHESGQRNAYFADFGEVPRVDL